MSVVSESTVVVKANPVRKVFRPQERKNVKKIPDVILRDSEINECIAQLPENYNFEVHKTIWRIRSCGVKRVCLQMPEGLLMFSLRLCRIFERFTDADTVVMGDVTYGACCIDDYAAQALGADLLVHYGHSCLVPVDVTNKVQVLYVFVDIKLDPAHFIDSYKLNFQPTEKMAFFSTIQFASTLHSCVSDLQKLGYNVVIPQSKPLSPGEVLGCTSPVVTDASGFIYLGDGRFHIESIMIANPKLRAYRYDPYEKKMTEEFYDHKEMDLQRTKAIETARKANKFGLILGTLGHQGSSKVLKILQCKLECAEKKYTTVLLSEVMPQTLSLFGDSVSAWIQVACPRLSIDWGEQFSKPLLTPYESAVVLNITPKWEPNAYPMDFYASDSIGPWTPNHKPKPTNTACCGKCSN